MHDQTTPDCDLPFTDTGRQTVIWHLWGWIIGSSLALFAHSFGFADSFCFVIICWKVNVTLLVIPPPNEAWLSFRDSESKYFYPIFFKFTSHLTHQTMHVWQENGGWRANITRSMLLCNFYNEMFVLRLKVYTLWKSFHWILSAICRYVTDILKI